MAAALAIVVIPAESRAATVHVDSYDNFFEPQTLHIRPGNTVVWTNAGARDHTVTSDDGDFESGSVPPGGTFSHTFREEGEFYYHCRFHGARQSGMWGLVIVGNPEPPDEDGSDKPGRPTLVVPQQYETIQGAVDHARSGSTVVIRPGVYHETVNITTSNLILRGVDRFRTVLDGHDELDTGILVDGAQRVTVTNLTVRNYLGTGILFKDARDYAVNEVDAIKDRTFGIRAESSYRGVFKDSFAWGAGDAAFSIASCLACSALIDNVRATQNYLGYSGTNSTGVVIKHSVWSRNGVGIMPNSMPTDELAPNRGTYIVDNVVRANNYETVPEAGLSKTTGIPFGTGIYLAGTQNNTVRRNSISANNRYGVLVANWTDPQFAPVNNSVLLNTIFGSGIYDLAYSGEGANDCFSGNEIARGTGPPDIQAIYACPARPFEGSRYGPVADDVAVSLAHSDAREQVEPPEPRRPRCQIGAPGCDRGRRR